MFNTDIYFNRNRIQNMEREKGTHLYNKHSEFHKDFSSFQEMELKMKTEIKNEGRVTTS